MLAVTIEGINGEISSGDIRKSVVWTDLTPIPVTAEVVITAGLIKDGFDTKKKRMMKIGVYEFEILLNEPDSNDQKYGDNMAVSVKLTGFIKQCAKMGYKTERAVILDQSSFAAAYRACGADCKITKDVPLDRFYSFQGQTPSMRITPVFQREAALPRWKDGGVEIWRYTELAAQKPVTTLKNVQKSAHDSEFLRRHLIPTYYSYDDDGNLVKSNRFEGRALEYLPRASQRVVNNMSMALVYKISVTADYAPDVNAGDVLVADGVSYIIMTAAHQSGLDVDETSCFWLGVIE